MELFNWIGELCNLIGDLSNSIKELSNWIGELSNCTHIESSLIESEISAIKIESSPIQLESSVIQLERSLIELESSAIELESSLINWKALYLIEFMSIWRSLQSTNCVRQCTYWTSWIHIQLALKTISGTDSFKQKKRYHRTCMYALNSNINNSIFCRLRSIAAHRDNFVRRLFVCLSVCLSVYLSGSHTFLVVTDTYI